MLHLLAKQNSSEAVARLMLYLTSMAFQADTIILASIVKDVNLVLDLKTLLRLFDGEGVILFCMKDGDDAGRLWQNILGTSFSSLTFE